MKIRILLWGLTIVINLSAISQAGSLDNSFGGTGRVTVPVGNYNDIAKAVALQADGKIIVVGQSSITANNSSLYADYNFSVSRLNPNGTLDNTFDNDGKILIPTGPFSGIATSVAIQADGKILVAGRGFYNEGEDFTVVRLNGNGSIDNNFGVNGVAAVPIGFTDDECYDIVLQSDGKIVLAGMSYSDDPNINGYGFSIARLNIDGNLDNSFDNDGKKVIFLNGSLYNGAFSAAIQTDGKIILAGSSRNDASPAIWYSSIVRMLPDGSPDPSFDGDGEKKLITTFRNEASSVLVQPDGKLVLAGFQASSNSFFSRDMKIVRLNPDGSPDNSFGTNSEILVDFGSSEDYASDIVLQPDGKIVAVGQSNIGTGPVFAAIRLTTSGSLDNSFDGDGKLLLQSPDLARSVVLQPDGKIVIAAEDHHVNVTFRDPSTDFVVIRLLGGTCPDGDGDGFSTCNGDCDDNNPNVYPGATEICNSIDDDCDGQVDESLTTTFYRDADSDGFGNPNNTIQACSVPAGYVANNTDCDDTKILYADNDGDGYGAGAPAPCGVENNTDCNDANANIHATVTYYQDADNDGFGNPNSPVTVCQSTPPSGYVINNQDCDDTKFLYADIDGDGYGAGLPVACGVVTNTDCNDNDPMIHPGAPEDACNGIDNDCDGLVDEDTPMFTYYFDGDGDGWGIASQTIQACAFPTGYAVNPGDCNDNNSGIHPGATELCNGVDEDCDGQIDEGAIQTYFRDNDGDGYGNNTQTVQGCSPPAGYVINANDCNDNNAAINPGASEICNGIDDDCDGVIDDGLILNTYYRDFDGDGYGIMVTVQACSLPQGYANQAGDCNDNNASIHPGATEVCNSVDDDCDGQIDENLVITWYRDSDGDGYGNPNASLTVCFEPQGYVINSGDCNDSDPGIHPGATEICNEKDDNCNGQIDEGFVKNTYYKDVDGDGYGDPNNSLQACIQPFGYATNNSDCDDSNDTIYPNATEYCNGIDENCNGVIDDNPVLITWYRDADGDGWGNPNQTVQACTPPQGYIREAFDCDDTNAEINPGATEIINNIDDDCDGEIDEGVLSIFYRDMDTDGYGDPANSTQAATQPPGYVVNNTDCNDNNASIHPGATETCNSVDDDCDGIIDEGVEKTFYRDFDTDGYGNPSVAVQGCTAPAGYVSNSTDCNDNNAAIYPGATEICNSVDDDCDGQIDEAVQTTFYQDFDTDGYGNPSVTVQACTAPVGYVANNTDCNDNSVAIHPGATEVCNSVDDDCDGLIDEGVLSTFYRDIDTDGYGNPSVSIQGCTAPAGYVANNTDCNDNSATIHPGATEVCNSVDDDCDGQIDEAVQSTFYRDFDTDGYGNPSITTQACTAPAGYVSNSTDCNDNNAAIHPGATEVCGNSLDDNCNGQIDENTVTAIITPSGTVNLCNGSTLILSANTGTGYIYQWYRNNLLLAGQSGSSISVTSSGNYTVRITNSGNCVATSVATNVQLVNPPKPGISIQGGGNNCPVSMQAHPGGAVSYQWNKNNIPVAGATQRNYSATTSGSYTVTVTKDGCSGTSSPVIVSSCPQSAVLEYTKNNEGPESIHDRFKIYPNPASENFIIELNLDDQISSEAIIQLTTLSGSILASQKIMLVKGRLMHKMQLNQKWSDNIYIVKVITGKQVFTARLMILKD